MVELYDPTQYPLCTYRWSIDPGKETGVAIWREDEWSGRNGPVVTTVIKSYQFESGDWIDQIMGLGPGTSKLLSLYPPTNTYIEFPQFFDSGGGNKSAKSGSLQKLTFSAGVIAAECHRVGSRIHIYEVNKWKGQMPKSAVIARLQRDVRRLDRVRPTSHDWDAIGIGWFAKGRFN